MAGFEVILTGDTFDHIVNNSQCFTYNDAGRINTVSNCSSASYIYNAGGQRVYT